MRGEASISLLIRKTKARYEVSLVQTSEIKLSPENVELYGEIDFNSDPALPLLKRSIAEKGLEEPLILTRDNFILSGHRRFRIIEVLGWPTVPCRYANIWRTKSKDFHKLLAEYNPQRVKSAASILAENFLLQPESSKTPLASWWAYRKKLSKEIAAEAVNGAKNLGEIGARRAEFLAAVQSVVKSLEQFWPVTVRTVHYRLLNDPPLTQVTSGSSERWRYKNDLASYNKLSGLLTLARYHGHVPWRAIADATRETREFQGARNLSEFIADEARTFLNGYARHRLEGQPNQVEVIIEKNTLIRLVEDICGNFHVPFTPLRGYGGASVWHELHMRWLKKSESFPDAKLILIFVTDHDPEGLDLMDDAVRSLRDKHQVPVQAIRAGVTQEQVLQFKLSSNPGKESSTRFKSYVRRTGTNRTWECEALEPEDLRHALHGAILSALNIKQLRAVEKLETDEDKQLEKIRERIAPALRKILLEGNV